MDLLSSLSSTPFAYDPRLTELTRDSRATLLLTAILRAPHDAEGWTTPHYSAIEDPTGLLFNEVNDARERLRKAGLLEEAYTEDLPRRRRYRLNTHRLETLWAETFGMEVSV